MNMSNKTNLLILTACALFTSSAYAADSCTTDTEINNTNHLILTSSPASNARLQTAEFVTESDTTGSVYRSEQRYDRCGRLTSMLVQLIKNERLFKVETNIDLNKSKDGWKNNYDTTLYRLSKNQLELLYAQEGTTLYHTDQNGLITNSVDSFVTPSGKGLTNNNYKTDDKNRLSLISTSSTEENISGDYSVFYNANNLPFYFMMPGMNMTYTYDGKDRINQMISTSIFPLNIGSNKADCSEWNSQNDCTKMTVRELEFFPGFSIDRLTVIRGTYRYWPD